MTEEEMRMAYQDYLKYQKELDEQRKWFDKYPLIRTGKVPREDFHDKYMPKLSNKVKRYGFEIKLVNMISSLDSVNENIVELFEAYERIKNNNPFADGHTCSIYRKINSLCSYIISDIRRFIDDMIAVCWSLSQLKCDENFDVENIDVDCIGACISNKSQYKVFDQFKGYLSTVNDLANSFKHSTTNNMQILLGRNEPCIVAVYAKHNKNISQSQVLCVSVRELVKNFNEFYKYSFRLIDETCRAIDEKE